MGWAPEHLAGRPAHLVAGRGRNTSAAQATNRTIGPSSVGSGATLGCFTSCSSSGSLSSIGGGNSHTHAGHRQRWQPPALPPPFRADAPAHRQLQRQHCGAALSAATFAATSGQPTPSEASPPPPGLPGGSSNRAPRRLILLRHADSEVSSRIRDYDRPISKQGRREAASIARRLSELGWLPDLIVASNSKRTRQTLDEMVEACEPLGSVDAHFLGSLYTVAALDGQTRSHLEEVVRGIASDASHFCVMCVGHNKGWEEAAGSFARQAVRLSTASAALLQAAGGGQSWEEATGAETEWTLVQVVTP